MLRNRLRILMAERGLKTTQVAKDTGISRNSITSIYYNKNSMMRLEILNTLLKYLNVTPDEFFNYNEMHEPKELLEKWEES